MISTRPEGDTEPIATDDRDEERFIRNVYSNDDRNDDCDDDHDDDCHVDQNNLIRRLGNAKLASCHGVQRNCKLGGTKY